MHMIQVVRSVTNEMLQHNIFIISSSMHRTCLSIQLTGNEVVTWNKFSTDGQAPSIVEGNQTDEDTIEVVMTEEEAYKTRESESVGTTASGQAKDSGYFKCAAF